MNKLSEKLDNRGKIFRYSFQFSNLFLLSITKGTEFTYMYEGKTTKIPISIY